MYNVERRYLDRISIPVAKVEYLLENGNSAKVKLIDMTKISVRFKIKHEFEEGGFVELKILIKDKDPIEVKGNVIWTKEENNNTKFAQAVVQFYPFGTDKRYNSMKSYEQLADLEREYSEEIKVRNNIYQA